MQICHVETIILYLCKVRDRTFFRYEYIKFPKTGQLCHICVYRIGTAFGFAYVAKSFL